MEIFVGRQDLLCNNLYDAVRFSHFTSSFTISSRLSAKLLFLGCNTQRYLSMRRFGGVLSLRDIVHCLVVYFFLVLLLFLLLSQTNQSTTD